MDKSNFNNIPLAKKLSQPINSNTLMARNTQQILSRPKPIPQCDQQL